MKPEENLATHSAAPRVERLPQIDGLRGFAISLVLLTHTWVFFGAPALAVKVAGHSMVLAAVPALGHVGVNLFLVISGFSLAWPFMRDPQGRDRSSLVKFFRRRAQRILPPYYASILVIYLLGLSFDLFFRPGAAAADFPHRPNLTALEAPANIWPHLFLIHNFWPQHVSTINGSYWSLALEWQLYILFPLFLVAFHRWGIWKLILAILIAQLVYRLSLEYLLSPRVLAEYEFVLPKAVPGRMFEFVLGMGMAKWVANGFSRTGNSSPGPRILTLGAACFLAFAAVAATTQCLPLSVIDVLWAAGFAGLVGGASLHNGWVSRIFSGRWLAGLGIASYSVYLLHQPLIERAGFLTLTYCRPGTAFFVGLALLPLVVGLCLLFYFAVERPCLKRIRKGRPERGAADGQPMWMPEAPSTAISSTP